MRVADRRGREAGAPLADCRSCVAPHGRAGAQDPSLHPGDICGDTKEEEKEEEEKARADWETTSSSARCLVGQWIHVHKEPFAYLVIFPSSPLYLALTALVLIWQSCSVSWFRSTCI